MAVVLFALCSIRSLAQVEIPGNETVASFKQLLTCPPAIEHMMFRERLPVAPAKPVPLDGGIAGSTNYALFELRYQSNGLYVRQLATTNDMTRGQLSRVNFTLWNDMFCFLDAGQGAFFYRLEHERARRAQVPPAYDAAWFRVTRYAEVLNLGLSHLWPGTVHWTGDAFRAQGIADRKPIFVSGRITRLTNDMPCELRVQYSNDVGVAAYRIAYGYARHEPPHFPSSMTLYLQHGGKEIEYRAYEILSLTPARAPLAEALFSPERFLRENRLQRRYYTNDSVYLALPSGRMIETRASSASLSLSRRDIYRNRYFYMVMALVTVMFFVLAFRAWACNNTTTQSATQE
jgi:hypothetical protein